MKSGEKSVRREHEVGAMGEEFGKARRLCFGKIILVERISRLSHSYSCVGLTCGTY